MRKLLLAISLTVLLVAPVRAEEINLGDLQVVEHFSMTPGTQAPAILTAPYSNVTTFLGQGVFDPPTVGSSGDVFFHTTAAGSFFPLANPVGALMNLGGTPIASFGWEFTVDAPVPTEDSSWGRVKAQYRN